MSRVPTRRSGGVLRRRSPPRRATKALVAPLWCGILLLGVAQAAHSHEPLWGETPTVFGFGVLHPEVKWTYLDTGSSGRGGKRMLMREQEYLLGYAPSTALNLRLEIPLRNNLYQERVRGRLRSAHIRGVGDLVLSAKRRFAVRQAEGLNIQHSVLYGVKLPTGESDHRAPDGSRANPHEQPGTGRPGILLGYSWNRETVRDTLWASIRWSRDLGGGFRMGDMLDLDAAQGRWVVRANEAREWGLNLALGIHGEYHVDDPLGASRTARNGHHLLGIQFTPIVTRGNHQFRVGVMVPVLRGGARDHTSFPCEVRVAFETFF